MFFNLRCFFFPIIRWIRFCDEDRWWLTYKILKWAAIWLIAGIHAQTMCNEILKTMNWMNGWQRLYDQASLFYILAIIPILSWKKYVLSLVFRFSKDLYLIMTQKLTLRISWNSADFMKSWVIAPLLHSIKLKTFCWNIWFYKVFGGFHEIRQISHEIRRISKDQLPGMVTPMF